MIAEIDCASASYLQNIYGYHLKMVKVLTGFHITMNAIGALLNEELMRTQSYWRKINE